MATDLRDYFNTRLTQELEKNAALGISTKYDDIQAASEAKVASLRELRALRIKERELQRASLAGRMDLDPNGIPAQVVNIADAMWQGTKSSGRSIGSAGNLVSGDLAAIDDYALAQKLDAASGPLEKQQLLAEIERRKALDQDPSLVSAVKNVAGAMVDNPAGSAQFIAEQAPNTVVSLGTGLAGGKAGAVAGSVFGPAGTIIGGGVGFLGGMFLGNALLETGGKAIEKAQNGGMTEDKRVEALKEGAVKAGVITAVDAATLGAGGLVAKGLNKAAIAAGARAEARVLANAGVDIGNVAAIEAALADPILRGVAKAAGRAAAKETSTIGSKAATAGTGLTMETAGEGVGEHLGELAATGKADIYDSVLEAAAGFTQSVPETAMAMRKAQGNDLNAKEMTKADLTIPDPVPAERKSNVRADDATKEAAKTGDVSALIDIDSKTYAPDKAIAALATHSMLDGTTDETKQSNFEQAGKIIADLEQRVSDLQAAHQMATPEGIAKLKDRLIEAQSSGDPETVKLLEEMIADSEANPEVVTSMANRLTVLETQLQSAKDSLGDFHKEMQPTDFDVKAEATKIDGTDVAASQATADRIINLSMAVPERLDAETATKLADDSKNGLSEEQRSYFRAFSQARIAENEVKGADDVANDIFTGSANYVGLNQYRAATTAALASGNRGEATVQMNSLGLFVKDHSNKAAQVALAYRQQQQDKRPRTVRSDGKQGWFIEEGDTLTPEQRKKEGALLIDARSPKLVKAIQHEAKALEAGQAELQAAFKLKPAQIKPTTQQQTTTQESSNGNQAAETKQTEAQGSQTSEPVRTTSASAKATQVEPATSAVEDTAQSETTASTEEATTVNPKPVSETAAQSSQEQSTEETSTETGTNQQGLSVLQTKTSDEELPPNTKLGQVYATINKVVAFLTQRKTPAEKNTDIAKDRPLVSIANFMSMWSSGDVVPSDSFERELLDTEVGALNNFKKVYDLWAPLVRANLKKGSLPNLKGVTTRDDFLYEDPIQDFFDADGSIDENVVTAIVYGAYSWLVDSMNGPALKDKDDILKMHGVQGGDVEVSDEGRAALARMTVFKDAGITAIGRYMVQALGLKANAKADATYMAKLTAAFGLHGLVLLAQDEVNLIDTVVVDGADLMNYLPGLSIEPTGYTKGRVTKDGNTTDRRPVYPKLTYLRIRRDASFQLPDLGRSIRDASVQSFGVVQRLFSTEHEPQYATWEPVKFKQDKAKRTTQGISKKQRRILEKAQQIPHHIIPSMWNALNVLGDQVILTAAGWTDYEPDRIQKANRESVMAKNQGLEDQLFGMRALVQNAIDNSPLKIDQPFFAAFEVWKNFRVGIATRDMNLQSSKIHRFMFFRPEWRTTIKKDDAATREQFLVAVAQAFGIKVDQQSNDKTLDKFKALVDDKDGRIQKMAVKLAQAIAAPSEEILNPAQKQAIGEFAANTEGMQTLQALVAYGKFLVAEQANEPEVTVEMLVGVDGKTNGPMLTHLALGADTNGDALYGTLNRGGMYRESDGVKNYNHWYERLTSLDLYEDLAQKILADIPMTADLRSIYVFTKTMLEDGKVTSAGRNLAKTPLTSFIFGSSVDKSISNMQEGFVQSVIDRIQKVANGEDRKTTTKDIIRGLNQLMDTRIPESTTIEQLMERDFTLAERQKLKDKFFDTIGERVKGTMKDYFGSYLIRRNDINRVIQGSYYIYDVIYKDLRAKEMNRLMDEGEIAFTETKNGRVPKHDMTAEQEKALRAKVQEVLPLANTAYTVDSHELDSGLYMAKTRRAVSSIAFNRVKVQLGRLIPSGDNWRVPYITGFASEQVEASPGVAGLPYFMHSLDSFIMHDSIEDTQTLNVHDEAANGVGNIVKTAQAINKSTWDAMLNFSPATEAYFMFARSLLAMNKMIKSGQLDQDALTALVQTLQKQLEPESVARTSYEDLAYAALVRAFYEQKRANQVRLQALVQMTAIDQYTWEGGQYDVTEADREKAKAALAQLEQTTEPSGELLAAAKSIGEALGTLEVAQAAQPLNEQEAHIVQDAIGGSFGPLGSGSTVSNPALVAAFGQKPKMTAGEVINLLASKGGLSPVNLKILKLVSRVVPKDLPVQMVTPKTAPEDVLELPDGPAHGWYVVKGGKESIYVLSPDFVASGLTGETLLHELVHAALAKIVDNPSEQAKELVAELESLRLQAEAYVNEHNLTQHQAAVSHADPKIALQEFIAWGISNRDFQRDVLNKLRVQSKTRGNALVDGMKKFIETISAMLFKKPDEQLENGLAVLVSNVSGLFNEANRVQQQAGDLNLSQAAVNAVDRYTTQDLFDALDTGAVTPAFADHLRGLLGGIVESLHGPFGAFKDSLRKTEAGNPLAVWLKAMETGVAPLASAIVASNFAGSAQEDFVAQQVEATIKAALAGNEATTKTLYKELYKLYSEAHATLKPSDFESQADYDFLFDLKGGLGDRSDYLARFAALGLANQKVAKLLQFDTAAIDTTNANKSLFDRMVDVYTKILAFFAEKMYHVYGGQPADVKLQTLVEQLVDIEARKRAALVAPKSWFDNVVADVEDKTKIAADAVRSAINDTLSSKFVKNNSLSVVRAAGTVGRVMALGQADAFMANLRKLRDAQFKERDGLGAGLLNELKGPKEIFNALLRVTKHNENQRKGLITQHAKMALSTFKDGGANLSREAKKGITAVFMRSGAHNLLEHFTMAELEKLVSDSKALEQAIADFSNRLTGPMASMYINQANGLGMFKARGRNEVDVLMLNAHVISKMAGTPLANRITAKEAAAAEPIIAVLASLYAIRYAEKLDVAMAKEVIRTENARTDGNGVEFVLQLHKQLEAESLERLFGGNKMLMEHGYVPDVINPHTEVVVADVTQSVTMKERGYSLVHRVKMDKDDPEGDLRSLWVLRDGGLAPWLSGILSLTSMKAKGSTVHSGFLNPNNATGLENSQMNSDLAHAKMAYMTKFGDANRNLIGSDKGGLVPVYNDDGDIVNWRYLMHSSTKDNVLERDNRFEQLLGTLAGSIFDKVASPEQNYQAIRALRDQYREDGLINPEAYIEVGKDAADPEMLELWNMLPRKTKADVRALWGRDGMRVRKDSLDLFFGYRKLSASAFLKKERDALDGIQKIARDLFHLYAKTRGMTDEQADNYAKKLSVKLLQGERAWQEIVREVKDIVVVKNIFTLLGNIYSNDTLLFSNGVTKRWHHQLVAIKGAMAYHKDMSRLMEIETMLQLGYTQGKDDELRREAMRLRDLIDRNPVKPLIDAGLMPTIVEDVAADEDIYSYKTLLSRRTEKFTNQIPEPIRNFGKQVYMTHDTKAYQFLSRTTQLSDFVARYALYQHLTTRDENPLSHEDAVQAASDAFVNYDIPMHRKLQYMDDMGFTPFIKYFFRIQRVLLKTFRENPARMLSLLLLQRFADLGPIVLDSSMVHHLGNNPFRSGALQIFGVLDELPAVAGAMKLLK